MNTISELLNQLAGRRIFIVYALRPQSGGAKLDKVPIDPRTGANIDAQNPAHWMLPGEAIEQVEVLNLMPLPAGTVGFGVGLVIHPETKFFFLDLDSCLDAAGGWQPHALAFLERFPRALREVSVSNTGLHVFGSYAGDRPLHRVKNADYRIELYTGGRFAALGHSASGDIFADCTGELHALINQFFPPRGDAEGAGGWTDKPVAEWRGPADDETLLQVMLQSTSIKGVVTGKAMFRDLWNCNVEVLAGTYPPQKAGAAFDGSSADLALFNYLAFYTGNDCARMLRIAQREDCGMRREKWGREGNYLIPTVLRAVTDQTEFYKGSTRELPPQVIVGEVVPTGTALTAASVPPPPPSAPPAPPPTTLSFLPETQAPHVLTLNNRNRFEATIENLKAQLLREELCSLGFDTFRNQIMISQAGPVPNWHPITDVDMVNLREALGRRNFAAISKDMLRDALLSVASLNSYDSMVVWLTGLRWDGVPRIDKFLATYCGAADDDYTGAVSRYIWTGMVCRVFEPGCKLDMVPVFQSIQGTRKSEGLGSLAPLPEFFTDNVSLLKDDDNFKRMIRGKIVVEIAELAGLGRAEVEFVKRMITRKVEEWTEKWQVTNTRYARRCMMFGSTNNKEFLPEDPTGQRRWLPVEIVALLDDLITRDRDQLWAEAAQRWQALKNRGLPGVDFHDAERLAKGRHQKYEIKEIWEPKIETWLNTEIAIDGGPAIIPAPRSRPFTTHDVLEGAIRMTVDKMTRATEMRAAKALRSLGYENKNVRVPGHKHPVPRWVPNPEAALKEADE